MTLTEAAREAYELKAKLTSHQAWAQSEEARIRSELKQRNDVLAVASDGLDADKIQLAETVVSVSDVRHGGAEWRSCIRDAVQQLSTGQPVGNYTNLWNEYFGTKNYDRWSGQRSDHEYSCGPRHGSICFQVGLRDAVRKRVLKVLTAEETEAAIYYLLNVERIQAAKQKAAQ